MSEEKKQFEPDDPIGVCVVCGDDFLQYRRTHVYCSMKCRNKHHYRERAEAFRKYREELKNT